MTKKVLVAVTSVAKYPNLRRATGLWLSEAVHFVKEIQEAGYAVDYVSPQGGYTPIDPHSLEGADDTDWQWYQDKAFMNRLGATMRPDEVRAEDYAAIYYAGGHGTAWDFPENEGLQDISRNIYENGGYVTGVCHGVVALLNLKLSDGKLLIDGKRLTGFSDEEERLAELDSVVPFLTETELRACGGIYEKADKPFAGHAVADGRLITGQNPASGAEVGRLLVGELDG